MEPKADHAGFRKGFCVQGLYEVFEFLFNLKLIGDAKDGVGLGLTEQGEVDIHRMGWDRDT